MVRKTFQHVINQKVDFVFLLKVNCIAAKENFSKMVSWVEE